MRVHIRATATAVALACALAGCATVPSGSKTGKPPAGTTPTSGTATGHRCPSTILAGSRRPGYLNPAVPSAGLYPAPGGIPSAKASGVTLLARSPVMVVSYGQPLERAATRLKTHMVRASRHGAWWQTTLAAGYSFEAFGLYVPLFGIVPGPVLSGGSTSGVHSVWLVTQWDAVQSLTLLSGNSTLAAKAPLWRQIPRGITAAGQKRAAARVQQAKSAGWRQLGVYQAKAACGYPATALGPFGARATLKLPLNVPLQLVVPADGNLVFEVRAG